MTFCGEETLDVLSTAGLLKKGILPESGNLADQPWRLMKVLEYANQLIRTHEVAIMGQMAPLLSLGL